MKRDDIHIGESMTDSVLTKNQTKKYDPRPAFGQDEGTMLNVTIRYEDSCGNGHNSFAITGTLYKGPQFLAGGCLHEDIAATFPELAPLIKWHLCSSDGPMHYVANTAYFIRQCDLPAARYCAIWPDATDEDLTAPGLQKRLEERLPALLAEFRAAVESLGFIY
jgi:hypothetical protein